jgi:hypothetical protein
MDTQDQSAAGKPAQTPPTQGNGSSGKLNLAAYRRACRRHANQEAYWAGRNRAARRSTRAAA